MKLIYRIVLRLSIVLVAVLSIWAILFYYAIVKEINDEADDSLEDYAEMILIRFLRNEKLPAKDIGSNNQFFISEISAESYLNHSPICFYDSMIYINEKKEEEPARVLTNIFEDNQGRFHKLMIMTPTFERQDMIESILFWIVIIYLALIIVIILTNVLVFYSSMKPLYVLLHWLDNYKVGKPVKLNNPTEITEFQKLNDASERYASRVEHFFEKQKQFIDNASHELQTPLAICQNRLEMLMEDGQLSENQLEEIGKTYHSLQNISRLNKSLLLLSRIDNGQYMEAKDINFNSLIKRFLSDFEEVYSYKNILVQFTENKTKMVLMNESLATILITNLLKNAFVHNVDNGKIQIIVEYKTVIFKNTGKEILDANLIFERFYQGSKRDDSTGLGLSIVDSICRFYKFKLSYSFDDSWHCFEIAVS